jgi:hypothetical protein
MLLLKDAKLSMLTSRRVTIFLSILLLALKTEELRLENLFRGEKIGFDPI